VKKKRRSRHVLLNILILFLSLGTAGFFGYCLWDDIYNDVGAANQDSAGVILLSARTVQRNRVNRVVWENASTGLAVYYGDKIRTGSDSAVRMTLYTGDVIELGPDSLIEIGLKNPGAPTEQIEIHVDSGTVNTVSSSGRVQLQPRTAAAQVVESGGGEEAGETEAAAIGRILQTAQEEQAQTDASTQVDTPEEEKLSVYTEPQELPAPAIIYPASGNIIGRTELAARSGLVFSWTPVPGAVSYRFSLESASGSVLQSVSTEDSSVYISNLSLFRGRDSMVWTVRALVAAGNEDIADSSVSRAEFSLYIPALEAPQAEEAIRIR
jgi:hypothetical protein